MAQGRHVYPVSRLDECRFGSGLKKRGHYVVGHITGFVAGDRVAHAIQFGKGSAHRHRAGVCNWHLSQCGAAKQPNTHYCNNGGQHMPMCREHGFILC